MITIDDIVKEARFCVGTEWVHQGRRPKIGQDCIGLVLWPAMALDLPHETLLNYKRQGPSQAMIEQAERLMDRTEELEILPGRAVALDMRGNGRPRHMGVLAEFNGRTTLIHAFEALGKVTEATLDERWRGRIHSTYRYRGGVDYGNDLASGSTSVGN